MRNYFRYHSTILVVVHGQNILVVVHGACAKYLGSGVVVHGACAKHLGSGVVVMVYVQNILVVE